MGCQHYREALSARLDGEDEPVPAGDTDRHLRGCAACRDWLRDATAVTRMLRVQPVEVGPRLDPAGLVRAARPRRTRLVAVLRLLLGLLGAAQFVLGVAHVALDAVVDEVHGGIVAGDATSGHLWHESAAWNIAVGAGFIWIAWRRSRPGGAVPMLTAFVALVVLLNASDVLAGQVDGVHLLGHGALLAGYGLALALCHPKLDPGTPPRRRGRWRRNAAEVGVAAPSGPPSLRILRGEANAHTSHEAAA